MPTIPDSSRAALNRRNSQYSTGPRTPNGKLRSSQNAVTHGLTSRQPVLSSEDPEAYKKHCEQFHDEYQPGTPTENQLTQELADTAWRLNRIPTLEAKFITSATDRNSNHQLNMVDTHRTLATLGLHGQRLSRQFQRTLQLLRQIQADRRQHHDSQLALAAGQLEIHKAQGMPYDPANDGFVFSVPEIELAARRLILKKSAGKVENKRAQTASGSNLM